MIICKDCGTEFDLFEKRKKAKELRIDAGKRDQCLQCADQVDAQPLTGVMIYGHKTGATIQINKDPKLTEYMLKSSPSAGSRKILSFGTTPHTKDAVHTHVKDVAKRRE
jgi:hypothetical protein